MSFDFDPSHFSTLEAFWGGGVGENFGGSVFYLENRCMVDQVNLKKDITRCTFGCRALPSVKLRVSAKFGISTK
jgi:hypothetical protein